MKTSSRSLQISNVCTKNVQVQYFSNVQYTRKLLYSNSTRREKWDLQFPLYHRKYIEHRKCIHNQIRSRKRKTFGLSTKHNMAWVVKTDIFVRCLRAAKKYFQDKFEQVEANESIATTSFVCLKSYKNKKCFVCLYNVQMLKHISVKY